MTDKALRVIAFAKKDYTGFDANEEFEEDDGPGHCCGDDGGDGSADDGCSNYWPYGRQQGNHYFERHCCRRNV